MSLRSKLPLPRIVPQYQSALKSAINYLRNHLLYSVWKKSTFCEQQKDIIQGCNAFIFSNKSQKKLFIDYWKENGVLIVSNKKRPP